MARQNLEAFNFLEHILKRPALYTGSPRFDYFFNFVSGYYLGKAGYTIHKDVENNNPVFDHTPHHELQYWLLHTQSATLSSHSLSGRSLFFRCFGIRETAFRKYTEFLYSELPLSLHDVYMELQNYEDKHDLVRHDLINEGIPAENMDFVRAAIKSIERYEEVRYDWADDNLEEHRDKLAVSVVENIKKMLDNSKIEYDTLLIYVRKERAFNQVRFLYRQGREWLNDCEIISNPLNHDLLIAVHANAKNASRNALQKYGCHVDDTQDYDFEFVPENDYDDDKTFDFEYSRWRSSYAKRNCLRFRPSPRS